MWGLYAKQWLRFGVEGYIVENTLLWKHSAVATLCCGKQQLCCGKRSAVANSTFVATSCSTAVAGRLEGRTIDCSGKMLYGTFLSPPHSSDGSTITITPPCALGILRCDTMSNTFICQLSWSHLLKIVQRNVVLYKMH